MSPSTVVLLLVLSEAVTVAGDVAAKLWVAGRGPWWMGAALLSYLACAGAWLAVLRGMGGDLARAMTVWVSASAVGAVFVGAFWFRERMTAWNWAGVALAMAGGYLASRR